MILKVGFLHVLKREPADGEGFGGIFYMEFGRVGRWGEGAVIKKEQTMVGFVQRIAIEEAFGKTKKLPDGDCTAGFFPHFTV